LSLLEFGSDSNPADLNSLYHIVSLLRLGIELYFVFDGKDRPAKRGKASLPVPESATRKTKEMLTSLSVPWHEAPGEAEAECAAMETHGFVDAVWSDDSDAFMFGCQNLIRFHYMKVGKDRKEKSKTHFSFYKSTDVKTKFLGLDREGFVFLAVLSGGDYDPKGLPGFGPTKVIEALRCEPGLAKALCEASTSDLPAWRLRLDRYVEDIKSNIQIKKDFPDIKTISQYKNPTVTSKEALSRHFRVPRPATIDEEKLKKFLGQNFGSTFDGEHYVKWIVPVLLVRLLLHKTSDNGPQQAGVNFQRLNLQLERQTATHTANKQRRATFLLVSIASLDMSAFPKSKRGRSVYDSKSRVDCESLECILEKGVVGIESFFPKVKAAGSKADKTASNLRSAAGFSSSTISTAKAETSLCSKSTSVVRKLASNVRKSPPSLKIKPTAASSQNTRKRRRSPLGEVTSNDQNINQQFRSSKRQKLSPDSSQKSSQDFTPKKTVTPASAGAANLTGSQSSHTYSDPDLDELLLENEILLEIPMPRDVSTKQPAPRFC
jgi:5'-3' exonuclease